MEPVFGRMRQSPSVDGTMVAPPTGHRKPFHETAGLIPVRMAKKHIDFICFFTLEMI